MSKEIQIEGKIKEFKEVQSGEGKNGEWKKQNFIITTDGEYPKDVCITAWGDTLNLSEYKANDNVIVSVNIESREYNERWYTDVKAWRIKLAGKPEQTTQAPQKKEPENLNLPQDSLPF